MVDLKIKVLNVGRNITMTKDNVKLTIDSSIAYRITNPIISHYVLGNKNVIKETIKIEHLYN
jgi:regulator of protease activity HflC (stomatin/prohibitin superfamily)